MPNVKGAVAALAALSLVNLATSQNAKIVQNDTYFYGQSPPVYPSPQMAGNGGWGEALSKAQAMVSQMSLEEKVNITGGYESKTTACSGSVPAINRPGFPGMCVQHNLAGVRGVEGVNGYPAGVHVGASWNKSLAYDQAYAMAGEFKRAGATHFIGNEQEEHRFEKRDLVTNHMIKTSLFNINDKTMHEMYMWPFADAFHAGTAMRSYQRVNNSYACQNSNIMNGLLKTELGFQGFVMSDSKGQKTGTASALAGMDMMMPLTTPYWGPHLLEAVRNGSVPDAQVENMATRVIAAWYYSNQDDPSVPQSAWVFYVCLVFINNFSSEGVDRPSLHNEYSDKLVTNITSQCPNTIVVIRNAGICVVDQWIDNPTVTAVIFAHLPGQDSGAAITKIFYGDVSPSGKLTYTIFWNESDYGALFASQYSSGWDKYFLQDNLTEGLFIDYRAFNGAGITPRFEFGFGLTYTTFKYTSLKIENTIDPSTLSPFPTGPIIPGGHADLWDTVATVTADVTNTGDVPAAEVAQLYLTIPGEGQPVRQLRRFDKVMVQPGETKTFVFGLRGGILGVLEDVY
ncbi:hypothetical protein SI65_00869 [Aspergillus cristatus]|uniref:Probable beta-glucosidase M n=1 Tax=Aspergillus cristatus TaxID=573508 RepID=A0A1E3BQQ2_ASPCR|nr:hypothetical protein SI65_00869 [Aspergillus cristatus]